MATVTDTYADESLINSTDGSEVTGGELRNLTDDNTLEFNGTSDYVDIGGTINATTSGSISVAFKSSNATNYKRMFNMGYYSSSSFVSMHFQQTTGYVSFVVAGSATSVSVSSKDYTDDKWHIAVGTWDSSGTKLYVDGILVGSNTTNPNVTSLGTLGVKYIGAYISGDSIFKFDGKISQVKLWNRALSSQEVANLYKTGDVEDTTGQVSYWKLDEGTGTSITDSWGSNTGTLTGGTWKTETISSERSQTVSTDLLSGEGATQVDDFKYTTSKKGGRVGSRLAFADDYDAQRKNVLSFDGVDDYVSVADSDDFSFGDSVSDEPFSISAWINMNDATGFQILSKGNWVEWQFYTSATTDKLVLSIISNGNANNREVVATTALTPYENQWIHVSGTYDGRGGTSANLGLELYVNGVLATDARSDAGTYVAMGNTAQVMTIGKEGADYANGQISNVRIYNDALTADEVKYLYTNGAEGTDPTDTNLVSYWKLDEGTGTTATDSAGSNNGTITGATWDTDVTLADWFADWKNPNGDSVKQRACYSFDGVNDKIDFSLTTPNSAPLSIAAWIKLSSLVDVSGVVCIGGENGIVNHEYAIIQYNDVLWATTQGTSVFAHADSVKLKSNTWIHVVAVYVSSNERHIYINGILSGSNTTNITVDPTYIERTRIGNRANNNDNQPFDGTISDAQIYSSALSATEVWDLYSKSQPKATGQVSRWKLDGNALDSWGSNDGTVSGATVVGGWEQGPPKGIACNERTVQEFDGVNDYVDVGDITGVDNKYLTISAWIKTDSDDQLQIVTKDDAGADESGRSFQIRKLSSAYGNVANLIVFTNSATGTLTQGVDFEGASGTSSISDNKWHFISANWDGSNIKLYVDGVLEGTTAFSQGSGINAGDANAFIGKLGHNSVFQYFDGQIANVAIWNDVRTAEEIQADYQNGYIDTTDSNLVSYWPLDGDFLDYKGSNDGTNYGSTAVDTLYGPIKSKSQETVDLSTIGGSWDKLYYKKEVDNG